MPAKVFSAKIVQAHAMQLITYTDPDSDNAKEVAAWCGGWADWNYDGQSGDRTVVVSFTNHLDAFRLKATDWLVCDTEGVFFRLSDEDFRNTFDTEPFDAPPTCQHCLSDPRYTPMGDPQEKRCPVCGVRYSGPRRTREYVVLVTSGLVAIGDDD